MTESQYQKKCIEHLKQERIYYVNIHGGGWTGKGTPDLITCIDGHFVAFELKVDKNTLSPDQVVRKNQIEKSGGGFFSPTSVEDFIKIIKEKKK